MDIREKYIAPFAKTVNLRSERMLCVSDPGNQTEDLNEEKFDW